MTTSFPLGNFDGRTFLQKYWQKKPLLIRQAFPDFQQLISPDELAGLACEQDVHSRIVLEKGGSHPWELRRGPFSTRSFKSLPKSHWTLLVNGVDRFLPEVNALLDQFRFVPNWRIDDVMVSYATKEGSVGAHIDNFDVFLIQAQGQREWQIEQKARKDEDYVPGLEIRLLQEFEPTSTWVLQPGDMLYLPPRVPHHGVSKSDDCMTYSIGFRAPSHVELVDAVSTEAISYLSAAHRYTDPDLTLAHPGEITAQARKQVRSIIKGALLTDEAIDRWFARSVTEPKECLPEAVANYSVADIKQVLSRGQGLLRTEGARISFVRLKSGCFLYANGTEFGPIETALAKVLTASSRVAAEELIPLLKTRANTSLVAALINAAVFYFPD